MTESFTVEKKTIHRNRINKKKRIENNINRKKLYSAQNIIYLNKIYQQNLASLKNSRPKLYQKILGLEKNKNYRIVKSENNLPNLKILLNSNNSFLLHSQKDPVKEAKIDVDKINLNNTNCIILLGLGLGYYVFKLLKRIPSRCHLFIVELDINIFKTALSVINFSEIFEKRNVDLIVGEHVTEIIPKLVNRFSEIKTTNVQVVAHSQSHQLHPEYKDIVGGVVKSIKIVQSNTETRFKYGLKWYGNSFSNILSLKKLSGVESLFNKFKDIPAIIISSGPSLDKNIKYLKNIKKGAAILISVDTGLKCLLSHNIKPDFVTSIDCQGITKIFFTETDLNDIYLISPFRIPPSVIKQFNGRTIFCDDKELNLWKEFRKYMENLGDVNIGGTVAIFTFDLVRKLGCQPIIFLGQDLSFPQDRYYALGSYKDDTWFEEIGKTLTIEAKHKELINKMDIINSKNIFNSTIKTSKTMLNWLTWFEVEIRKTKAQCINASEEGIFQKDMIILPFKEVYFRYLKDQNSRNRDWKKIILDIPSIDLTGLDKDLIPVSYKLEKIIQICEEITDKCCLLLKALSSQNNNELNMIHEKIKELCKRLSKEENFSNHFRLIYLIFRRNFNLDYKNKMHGDPRYRYISSIELEARSILEACKFIRAKLIKEKRDYKQKEFLRLSAS